MSFAPTLLPTPSPKPSSGMSNMNSMGLVKLDVKRYTKPSKPPSTCSVSFMPLLGFGLGVGTNVGANLMTGQTDFVLAEDEWERVMCKSGAILGSRSEERPVGKEGRSQWSP